MNFSRKNVKLGTRDRMRYGRIVPPLEKVNHLFEFSHEMDCELAQNFDKL
jgi:hypothetical protein